MAIHADIPLAFTYLWRRSSLQLNLENNCNAAVIKSLKLSEYQALVQYQDFFKYIHTYIRLHRLEGINFTFISRSHLSISTMKSNVLWFISNSTLFNPNSSNRNLYSSDI